tara:strand:- start:1521 stop:1901 length:381 start_codon:yes stop_codon:yes gene_type:complete
MNNIYLYLSSATLGIIIFFSIILAPTVFKVLDKNSISAYLRAFFPKFYLVLFLVTGIAAFLSPEPIHRVILIIISLLFLISRWPLTTSINTATDSNNQKKFKFLHALSVGIIILQIVMLFSLFFLN